MSHSIKRALCIVVAAIVVIALAVFGFQKCHDADSNQQGVAVTNPAEQVARGAYLARAGDCMACHTARGGQPYAGGRVIPTPYGNMFSPNITPDGATGIGSWTSNDFWRAMHNGKSKNGDFLYPVFPFPNYTKVTREDADAIFAYLKTVAPVQRPNQQHALRFPYNQRFLLAAWRALYFSPGSYQLDQSKPAAWNRGAYLVQGLGHCNACHTNRTALGASDVHAELAGGLIPMLNWYAPSLTSDEEAGVGKWDEQDIVDLLKTGVSAKGAVFGPMSEVVERSLQHLSGTDVKAIAGYLKSLPQTQAPSNPIAMGSLQDEESIMKLGAKLYDKHCSACHREDGKGYPPAYAPLAGNRALTMHSAVNPIRMVLNGGYPPSTDGNQRPFGMPPFGYLLNDKEVAAVVSYMRNSWGNHADLVSPPEVGRYRSTPLD